MCTTIVLLVWTSVALLGQSVALGVQAADPVDFNREVRPLLGRYCLSCHGRNAASRQGGLRLDDRGSATGEADSGELAIVPGNPEASELVARITAEDDDSRMPPAESGPRLADSQIAILRRWIEQGAPYAEHWSFAKPVRPALPVVQNTAWANNSIDLFVLHVLETRDLPPNPPADRYALLRRLSLDLRGLPPTLEEGDEFAADQRPDAYERMVDRFLADPAFGERWARVWLDLARYADSRGYGSDPLRNNMWRFRDWVIDALNRNLPYDQFTIEQLAGDLLPNPTLDQHIATAFHRNTMTNTEGGTDDEEFRVEAVKDRVDTSIQVWMGLTMGCAKCHDHKYDPISQDEYYQLFAVFNQSQDKDLPDEFPTIEAPRAEDLVALEQHQQQVADLERQLADTQPEQQRAALEQRLVEVRQARPALPTVPIMVEVPPDQRRATHVLVKGNFLTKGEQVEPGVPQNFHPLPADVVANRLVVARWLVDPDNPLTARVAVNRLWAQLFGTGIVATEEDFGTQGDAPSHPGLLDWLATEFLERNWDTKQMLRLLVTSATYRQGADVRPDHLAQDPQNRLLARGPRSRLEAEMVRDQALALSGLLARKVGGPSVYPYQPPGLWRAAFNGERTWPTSEGADRFRRGLYIFWRRTVPYPSLATFDAPSREVCTVRRLRTNTPLQAFVVLNDPVFVEASQSLARRMVRDGGKSTEERARYGLRLCMGRPPALAQVEILTQLYQSEREHYQQDLAAAETLATNPLGPLEAGSDAAEFAAWTVVANVLLNMDSVLNK